jgi:hypothetical protein
MSCCGTTRCWLDLFRSQRVLSETSILSAPDKLKAKTQVTNNAIGRKNQRGRRGEIDGFVGAQLAASPRR